MKAAIWKLTPALPGRFVVEHLAGSSGADGAETAGGGEVMCGADDDEKARGHR